MKRFRTKLLTLGLLIGLCAMTVGAVSADEVSAEGFSDTNDAVVLPELSAETNDEASGALPAPVDGTIVLTADVTLADTAVFTEDTVLDLAGHTITGTSAGRALRVDGGALTVKDSSEEGTGKIKVSGDQCMAIIANTTLTFEGGTVEVDGQDACGIRVQSGGSAVMTGGTVTADGVGAMCACCMGSGTTSVFELRDGVLDASGQGCIGIYLAGGNQKGIVNGGSITVTGVDSYGIEAIEQAATGHMIEIGGGSVYASGSTRTYAVYLEMDNTLKMTGGTLESDDAPGLLFFQGGNSVEITGGFIRGGTKDSSLNYGVYMRNAANNTLVIDGDPVITGGKGSVYAGMNRYKSTPAVTIRGGYCNGSVDGGIPSDQTDNYAKYDITGGFFTVAPEDSALYNYELAKDYTPETYTDEIRAGESLVLASVSEEKDGVTYLYTVSEKVFDSGSGTEEDPYVIKTAAQLAKFSETVDNGTNYAAEYLTLGADIDLSGYESWNPVGAEGKASSNTGKLFAGHFDGKGYTISGLTIHASFETEANVGLFSSLADTARVTGLTLTDVNIHVEETGSWAPVRAGAVAGDTARASGSRAAIVDGCSATGTVSVSAADGQSFAGGILGRAFTKAAVLNCWTDVTTDASSAGSWNAAYAGGIVGMTGNMTVMVNCAAFGDATAKNTSGSADAYAGGLTGMLTSTVYNCYATGNASIIQSSSASKQFVGALAGQQAASPKGEKNYYSSEAVLTVTDENGNVTTVESRPWSPDDLTGNATAEDPMSKSDMASAAFCKTLNGNNADVESALNESELIPEGWNTYTGRVLPTGEEEFEDEPAFSSHSLVLSGQIGVNFYVTVPEDFDTTHAKIVMTVNGKDTEIAWADGKDAGTNQKYFTCPLNSLEMGDTVTAVFSWGDGEEITNTYSVNEYVEYITGHADDFSGNAVALAEAIADYGHYVKPFVEAFGTTDGLDHSGIAAQNEMTDEEISRVRTAAADFALTKDLGTSGITVSYTLNLDAKTSVYLYLKAEAGVTVESATVDGKKAALKNVNINGEAYKQIRITNIAADKLGKAYTDAVTTSSGTAQITVSALSYVNTILNSTSFNRDAQAAMAAFYRYYEAAAAYKSNPNG